MYNKTSIMKNAHIHLETHSHTHNHIMLKKSISVVQCHAPLGTYIMLPNIVIHELCSTLKCWYN